MINELHLPLILLAALIASGSPGPATLAISSLSMKSGRKYGLAMASGIWTGSLLWSVSAAFGLGALMLANVWAFEMLRYVGAAYLIYLGLKSARSAMSNEEKVIVRQQPKTLSSAYARGLALHLTNPKAIFFFGSLYSIGVPSGASLTQIAIIIAAVGVQSFFVFHGYAVLFSSRPVAAGYAKMRRWCEALFALVFVGAGLKILTARLGDH
ncbi:MAG: LysE family translocator [Alphaproteobacteria bacterium]|nr:MAG: LysE family translocator [Alphaproteobacteria bacterium]